MSEVFTNGELLKKLSKDIEDAEKEFNKAADYLGEAKERYRVALSEVTEKFVKKEMLRTDFYAIVFSPKDAGGSSVLLRAYVFEGAEPNKALTGVRFNSLYYTWDPCEYITTVTHESVSAYSFAEMAEIGNCYLIKTRKEFEDLFVWLASGDRTITDIHSYLEGND